MYALAPVPNLRLVDSWEDREAAFDDLIHERIERLPGAGRRQIHRVALIDLSLHTLRRGHDRRFAAYPEKVFKICLKPYLEKKYRYPYFG